jgi:hypothetical protein
VKAGHGIHSAACSRNQDAACERRRIAQCHLLFAERTMATGFCFCSFRPGSAGVPPARRYLCTVAHWYTDHSGINQIVVAA